MNISIGLARQAYRNMDGEGTDFHAVKNGYVAITPIQADLTAHQSIAALQDWLESE